MTVVVAAVAAAAAAAVVDTGQIVFAETMLITSLHREREGTGLEHWGLGSTESSEEKRRKALDKRD